MSRFKTSRLLRHRDGSYEFYSDSDSRQEVFWRQLELRLKNKGEAYVIPDHDYSQWRLCREASRGGYNHAKMLEVFNKLDEEAAELLNTKQAI